MSLTVVGIAMGAFVAFMSFQFGGRGFLGALLFMGIGARWAAPRKGNWTCAACLTPSYGPAILLMSATAGAVRAAAMAGHTRISTQALTSVARALWQRPSRPPPHEVRAEWSDDDGPLALSLVSPITLPPLTAIPRIPDASRASAAPSGTAPWPPKPTSCAA